MAGAALVWSRALAETCLQCHVGWCVHLSAGPGLLMLGLCIVQEREQLLQGISLLTCLYNANKLAGFKIMPSEFYNAAVCEHVTLREEYMIWRRTKVRASDGLSLRQWQLDAHAFKGSFDICKVHSSVHAWLQG